MRIEISAWQHRTADALQHRSAWNHDRGIVQIQFAQGWNLQNCRCIRTEDDHHVVESVPGGLGEQMKKIVDALTDVGNPNAQTGRYLARDGETDEFSEAEPRALARLGRQLRNGFPPVAEDFRGNADDASGLLLGELHLGGTPTEHSRCWQRKKPVPYTANDDLRQRLCAAVDGYTCSTLYSARHQAGAAHPGSTCARTISPWRWQPASASSTKVSVIASGGGSVFGSSPG